MAVAFVPLVCHYTVQKAVQLVYLSMGCHKQKKLLTFGSPTTNMNRMYSTDRFLNKINKFNDVSTIY